MVTTISKPQSGGSEKTLLWTNSNPTSSFSAQTINLDLSTYSEIEIEFKHASPSESYLFQKVRVPSADLCLFYLNGRAAIAEIESREITVTTTGITFGDGKRAQGTFTTSTDNIRCVPIKIYGIN